MKKTFIIFLGILGIVSIIGMIYVYGLISKVINSTDTYHPPVGNPIIPKANNVK